TPAGAVPIESVRAGDLVWSRDPDTFLTEPRPVRETYVSHPAEWFHVGVDRDGDHRADETISGTGSHPWYVLTPGRVGFVPARELQAGDILSLRDGTRAWVADKTREVAPPGQTFTTYNFAVADHHTYFAGQGGVWVHNLCSDQLDKVAAEFETILEATIKKQGNTDVAWQSAERQIREKIQDLRKPGGKELSASDHADIGGYISARLASRGTHLARPTPWRIVSGNGSHEWIDADFVPDPRLVEVVRNLRLNSPEGNLLTKAGMKRNAACVKYRVNGEVRYEAMLNQGNGGGHSEELLSDFLHELRLQHGNNLEVEEIFTERIPCTNSGGCRPMMSTDMKGAQVSFWTREKGAVAESQLSGIYGLD
ncbi:MAG: polymorphic toxin-type HINT domain-containing protein, partial [Verrucomicrobiales bacterium]